MISEPPILTTVLAGAFVEKLGVAPELEISLLKAGLDLQPHRLYNKVAPRRGALVLFS